MGGNEMKSWFDLGVEVNSEQNKEIKLVLEEQEATEIQEFLADLERLEGVGPDDMAADPSMLPPESIRFFVVDENWVDCLIDGAFSTGGEECIDWERKIRKESGEGEEVRTGFLLRSVLVKAFPGIIVTARERERELVIERLAYMGEDVLLGIVRGEMDHLIFTEPEESLLCEFDYNKQGELCAGDEPVQFREGTAPGVVDLKKLARDMEEKMPEFSAAEFGRLLLRDGEEYHFIKGGKANG